MRSVASGLLYGPDRPQGGMIEWWKLLDAKRGFSEFAQIER
jgi:hypothetical protein